MTPELYKYIEDNKDTFNLWIRLHSRLEPSADILQPLIKPFQEANPGVNIMGCKDCIIDMLIWANIQLKNQPKQDTNERIKRIKKA